MGRSMGDQYSFYFPKGESCVKHHLPMWKTELPWDLETLKVLMGSGALYMLLDLFKSARIMTLSVNIQHACMQFSNYHPSCMLLYMYSLDTLACMLGTCVNDDVIFQKQ